MASRVSHDRPQFARTDPRGLYSAIANVQDMHVHERYKNSWAPQNNSGFPWEWGGGGRSTWVGLAPQNRWTSLSHSRSVHILRVYEAVTGWAEAFYKSATGSSSVLLQKFVHRLNLVARWHCPV